MADAWNLRPPQYLTKPSTAVHTFGPEVAAVCTQAGYEPDPEQRLILDGLFGIDENGDPSAFETAVIGTRQNLKTGVLKQAAIGWLFVTREDLITWSAHLFPTATEAFRDLSNLITSSPMLSKRLAGGVSNGIHGARGSESIELADGRRLIFRARTKTGGRGLTGDKMILDEAFALTDEHMGALIPTLTAVPDPQIVYGSSAGLAYSYVLREIRDRGRVGSPGLFYAEWCAERRGCAEEKCQHRKPSHPQYTPGCALDDEELWRAANPLLGRKRANGTGLTLPKMRKFREAEPPEEWMRERLGWWDESGSTDLFGVGKWEACRGDAPSSGLRIGGLGLAVSFDSAAATIVAGAAEGDRVHVKPLHHDVGVGWVVPKAKELQDRHGAPVIIDARGPGAELIPHLRQAGVDLEVIDTKDVLDACAGFHTLVRDARLQHADYPELEEAVAVAQKRDVGDRWAWGRRKTGADISALEAATWATWRVATPEPVEEEFRSAYEDHDPVMI